MEGKNSYRQQELIYSSIRFRILSFFVYRIVIYTIRLVFPIIFGHRIVGRENLQNVGSAVTVSNHCTYLDPALVAKAVPDNRIYFSIQQETVDIQGFGFFLRCLHGFPLPPDRPTAIAETVRELLSKESLVHFFPEGVLYDYNQELKTFYAGPFYFALKNNVPVIPITTVIRKRTILGRDLKTPWVKAISVVGEPVQPKEFDSSNIKTAAKEYAETVRIRMQKDIDHFAGDKSLYRGKIQHRI